MSKLDPKLRESIAECRMRALDYLATQNYPYVKASSVAGKIWPGHSMTSQGAGAAASRILKTLEKDGFVKWNSGGSDWGWELTREGRKRVSG